MKIAILAIFGILVIGAAIFYGYKAYIHLKSEEKSGKKKKGPKIFVSKSDFYSGTPVNNVPKFAKPKPSQQSDIGHRKSSLQ